MGIVGRTPEWKHWPPLTPKTENRAPGQHSLDRVTSPPDSVARGEDDMSFYTVRIDLECLGGNREAGDDTTRTAGRREKISCSSWT